MTSKSRQLLKRTRRSHGYIVTLWNLSGCVSTPTLKFIDVRPWKVKKNSICWSSSESLFTLSCLCRPLTSIDFIGGTVWFLEHESLEGFCNTLGRKDKERVLFSTDNCFFVAVCDWLTREKWLYSGAKFNLSTPFHLFPSFTHVIKAVFQKSFGRKLNYLTELFQVVSKSLLARGFLISLIFVCAASVCCSIFVNFF